MTDLSAYNQFTIRESGEGQLIGRAAEQEFAAILIQKRFTFEYVAAECGPVDFKVNGWSIDIKCKQRNVRAKDHYEAHVDWRLRDKECDFYVFASHCCEFEWMGYIRKRRFWEQAVRVEKGELRQGFTEKEDAGKLAYEQLSPIDGLFDGLRVAKR